MWHVGRLHVTRCCACPSFQATSRPVPCVPCDVFYLVWPSSACQRVGACQCVSSACRCVSVLVGACQCVWMRVSACGCVSSACQVRASLKQLLPLGLVLAGLVFVLCAEFRRANRWLRPQTVVGSVGSNKACNCGDKPNGLASASARTRLAPRLAPWLAPQLAPWLAPWQAPWRSTPGSACGRLPSPPLCAALSESDLDLAVPAVDNLPTAAWKEVRS